MVMLFCSPRHYAACVQARDRGWLYVICVVLALHSLGVGVGNMTCLTGGCLAMATVLDRVPVAFPVVASLTAPQTTSVAGPLVGFPVGFSVDSQQPPSSKGVEAEPHVSRTGAPTSRVSQGPSTSPLIWMSTFLRPHRVLEGFSWVPPSTASEKSLAYDRKNGSGPLQPLLQHCMLAASDAGGTSPLYHFLPETFIRFFPEGLGPRLMAAFAPEQTGETSEEQGGSVTQVMGSFLQPVLADVLKDPEIRADNTNHIITIIDAIGEAVAARSAGPTAASFASAADALQGATQSFSPSSPKSNMKPGRFFSNPTTTTTQPLTMQSNADTEDVGAAVNKEEEPSSTVSPLSAPPPSDIGLKTDVSSNSSTLSTVLPFPGPHIIQESGSAVRLTPLSVSASTTPFNATPTVPHVPNIAATPPPGGAFLKLETLELIGLLGNLTQLLVHWKRTEDLVVGESEPVPEIFTSVAPRLRVAQRGAAIWKEEPVAENSVISPRDRRRPLEGKVKEMGFSILDEVVEYFAISSVVPLSVDDFAQMTAHLINVVNVTQKLQLPSARTFKAQHLAAFVYFHVDALTAELLFQYVRVWEVLEKSNALRNWTHAILHMQEQDSLFWEGAFYQMLGATETQEPVAASSTVSMDGASRRSGVR